jgi:hypothetical protein
VAATPPLKLRVCETGGGGRGGCDRDEERFGSPEKTSVFLVPVQDLLTNANALF